MATKRMDESWSRVKTQIKSIWGMDFEDQELKKARGNLRQMVNLIQEKTGEDRSQILQKMHAIV